MGAQEVNNTVLPSTLLKNLPRTEKRKDIGLLA